MSFGPRYWTILLLLFSLEGPRLSAQDERLTELSPARIGAVYAHALGTSKPAHFAKVGSNSAWLSVTPEGVLTGTPDGRAPVKTEITVEASWRGHALRRSFVVPVRPSGCARGDSDIFAWCDDERADAEGRPLLPEMRRDNVDGPQEVTAVPARRQEEIGRFSFEAKAAEPDTDLQCKGHNDCIVQFHRLRGEHGQFGRFDKRKNRIGWVSVLAVGDSLEAPVIKAINGSKVFISGSVLIRKHVTSCHSRSWSVVTQTVDSSNNLFYPSSDLTTFCADDPKNPKSDDKTVLIVLPVHAIWANVYGVQANVNDPNWKRIPPPPKGHECKSADEIEGVPSQVIHPCDVKSNWLTEYVLRPFAWNYSRLTLPGVSQGSISLAPWASGTKATWDVQAYESTRLGPGWLGLQVMYEHDRKLADDLNSLTAALTYDLRIHNTNPFGGCSAGQAILHPGKNCSPSEDSGPPLVGVRPLEVILRGGPEWSPSAENTGATTQGVYMPKDLNLVMGATARLPIIISPIGLNNTRQPSQFTLVPVLGLEGGFRIDSHPICAAGVVPANGTSQCVPTLAPPTSPPPLGPVGCPGRTQPIANTNTCTQPQEILRRVAGVDASVRWPYNWTRNFLGDRPMTIDFSYRMRWLSYAEPFYNDSYTTRNPLPKGVVFAEGQSSGERSYTRATFIVPFSAYLQFRASWQHGSLPPLFQYVGNVFALGLAFSNPGSSEH